MCALLCFRAALVVWLFSGGWVFIFYSASIMYLDAE